MTGEYAFDSGTDLGGQQLNYLGMMFDGVTRGFVGDIAAFEGQRCLDLGSGNGSVARWLAERTGPTGEVHAVDIDTTHVDVPERVRVHRHDLNDGLPVGGPFDVIHTRLLLVHLERRREVLAELADALAPGGWLFVGEFTYPRTQPRAMPTPADAELFRRVIDTGIDLITRQTGQGFAWADKIDPAMAEAGLSGIDSMEHAETVHGGTTGCLLFSNYVRQLEVPMLASGLTNAELDHFHQLMHDPRTRVWFFPTLYTRGRKPDTT